MKSSLKIIYKILFGIFLLSLSVACNSQQLQSTDFTSEMGFTKGIEGPAVDLEGNLFAVNFKEEGTIGKVNSQGEGEIFVKLPGKSIGNGIRFDNNGDMYIADYVGHNVLQIKKGTKKPIVWAHNPEMSQPNDLAIAPNGTIYLSDPNWSENTGRIWLVNPDREIILLEENMGTANGIEVSPDGKKLYVNESAQRNVWQYDIQFDGTVTNKTKLITFEDFGMDGMRCDVRGNLYIARYDKGTIVVLSPKGVQIQEITLTGKKPSNITFGGPSGNTCYVTMADRGCFETFQAQHKGAFYDRTH